MAKTLQILLLGCFLSVVGQTGLAQSEWSTAPQNRESRTVPKNASGAQKPEDCQAQTLPTLAPANSHPEAAEPQQPLKLTLKRAIGDALAHHPSLRQARAAISAANARTSQAR